MSFLPVIISKVFDIFSWNYDKNGIQKIEQKIKEYRKNLVYLFFISYREYIFYRICFPNMAYINIKNSNDSKSRISQDCVAYSAFEPVERYNAFEPIWGHSTSDRGMTFAEFFNPKISLFYRSLGYSAQEAEVMAYQLTMSQNYAELRRITVRAILC